LPDEPVISYTLKEELGKIDRKLDQIDAKLDGKADKADVAALRDGHADHEGRIVTLETAEQGRDKGGERKRANWALALAALAAAAAVTEAVVQAVGH
jgi:hypothetical protein